jgi:hypothetical protein
VRVPFSDRLFADMNNINPSVTQVDEYDVLIVGTVLLFATGHHQEVTEFSY